jgi:hypothetical protein
MNCEKCNDTGSLSKTLDGYLDCGYCDVVDPPTRQGCGRRQ